MACWMPKQPFGLFFVIFPDCIYYFVCHFRANGQRLGKEKEIVRHQMERQRCREHLVLFPLCYHLSLDATFLFASMSNMGYTTGCNCEQTY